RRQIGMQVRKIQILIADDRRHAGAALVTRHLHAVDIGLMNAGECADRLGDFRGRDVLTLPAEGIADAVDEIEITTNVAAQEIARAEPAIPFGEHVAKNLGLVVNRIGIALEAAGRPRRVVENPADRLANLSGRGLLAATERIAYGRLPLDVEPHDPGLK